MKKWLVLAIVPVGLAAALVGTLLLMGLAPHTGVYLEADSGSSLIVLDGSSPVVMSNHTGDEAAFSQLETGDKLFVLMDGIDEAAGYVVDTDVAKIRVPYGLYTAE